jgi:LysR family hydrogen peroxide-inducible transcriptional activator
LPTLTQLEYIVAVDRLKHFGAAARACHVSQPSLSMQIQKVEDEVGIVIFDRLKKPIVATEKGQRFIAQARVVLKESSKLVAVTKSEQNEVSGDFRLGIIPTLAPYLLPALIEPFSIAFPKVRLKIDELKTDTIVSELQHDLLDAAILATPLHESGLHEKPLFYEPFYLYVSKESVLSKHKRVDQTELDGSEMWLLQDGHCLRNQVVRICSLRGEKSVFKNVQFEGGNLETLRYLIKKSRGYTLVPQLFVNTLSADERREFVKEFELPVPTREVSLVYRRDQWKLEVLHALENTIHDTLPLNLKTSVNKRASKVVPL